MLHSGSAPHRRTTFIFVCGLVFGFLATYGIFQTSTEVNPAPRKVFVPQFIPDAPHSHGETESESFVGPDQEQTWHDFGEHNHHDEDEVARYLQQKVRVLCWVMTSPSNIHSKARHVKATWGKRCNVLLFMSSEQEDSLPAIGLDISEGRDYLWGKTRKAFQYIYDHHLDDADWFLKADDDTYCIVENLRYLLANYDPKEPIHFGHRFKPYVQQGYMSGGAGYVLSKEAMIRFVGRALQRPSLCRDDPGGAEDLEMGRCLQGVGVRIVDSRDDLGRERFHPFVPELHLIPGLIPKDNWYWEYNYYPTKEGPDCCSDYSVTFHYVPPNMMYVFEYFIYHLRPFGVSSKLVLPSSEQDAALKYKPPKGIGAPTTSAPRAIENLQQHSHSIPQTKNPSQNEIFPSDNHFKKKEHVSKGSLKDFLRPKNETKKMEKYLLDNKVR